MIKWTVERENGSAACADAAGASPTVRPRARAAARLATVSVPCRGLSRMMALARPAADQWTMQDCNRRGCRSAPVASAARRDLDRRAVVPAGQDAILALAQLGEGIEQPESARDQDPDQQGRGQVRPHTMAVFLLLGAAALDLDQLGRRT